MWKNRATETVSQINKFSLRCKVLKFCCNLSNSSKLSKMISLAYVIPALPQEASEEENEGQLHMSFDNFKALPTIIIHAILQLHILDTRNTVFKVVM